MRRLESPGLRAFAQSFVMPAGGLFVAAYGALAIVHVALALRFHRSVRPEARSSGEP